MRTNQSGSAHIVVVSVLVIGLLSMLGFVFWQNFINKAPAVADKISTYADCVKSEGSVLQESYPETCVTKNGERFTNPDQKVDVSVMNNYCSSIEKLCFDYPKDWTIKSEKVDGDSDGMSELIIVSDQMGKTWLRLQTGLTGVGGSCGNEDNSYIKVLKTHTTKITGSYLVSDAAKDYMVDTMYAVGWTAYSGTDKKWTINMELNNSKKASSVGKIDICDLGIGVFNGKNAMIAGTNNAGAIKFGLNKGADTDSQYTTESEASAALATPEAVKAYSVLESAHYQ